MLIAFEGLDGSGKSTLARRTAEALGAELMTTPSPRVREYRERLLDDLGPCQAARQLFYMATVFAASEQIVERTRAGRHVVIDRYYLSTQAYAQFRGSELVLDNLSALLAPARLTIYLDAPLDIRRRRVLQRGASASDHETLDPAADTRLRELHLARASLAVVGRLAVVSSHGRSADETLAEILSLCR